jgi:hypothetical protein
MTSAGLERGGTIRHLWLCGMRMFLSYAPQPYPGTLT